MFAELKSRVNSSVRFLVGSGAPSNSATGVGDAGPGSTYIDFTNNVTYYNLGTAAAPVWSSLLAGQATKYRASFTTAQVNAGATILAAVLGFKWQVLDITIIAVGGNAATATTVDVLATQAAGSVKLLAVAVAALTRSAVVRAGAANATVLADGASFAANDANTAITIGKTGADLATATAILVTVDAVLVKA